MKFLYMKLLGGIQNSVSIHFTAKKHTIMHVYISYSHLTRTSDSTMLRVLHY